MQAFAVLGLRKQFGMVGEESCDEVKHGYKNNHDYNRQKTSLPLERFFHYERGDKPRCEHTGCKGGHGYEELRNGSFLVAENVSVFQLSHALGIFQLVVRA